ncbi:MAG: DUF1385 domain-containing protein [Ignavibacteria bacterium]|nr:DUF1385 domain-containing protein [Ignavibacteria bacterium]
MEKRVREQNNEAPVSPVGGQAVIEGVMMRSGEAVATAVRRSDGTIVIRKETFRSLAARFPMLKRPLLRGALGLIEMTVIGIRTLNYSAEVSLEEPGTAGQTGTKEENSWRLGLTVALSLLVGITIFFATPLVLTSLLFDVDQQALLFNLTAGGIRVALLLGYLSLISLSKEIRRVFEYHGAEHKAVFAFEKGEPLTVESAARQSRFHPRCGTSFLLIVMVSSILLFSVLDTILMLWLGELTLFLRLGTHLPLIPLVGGISYEFIRISAKKSGTIAGKIVAAPGLWLQRVTTREPLPDQLEVAIVALRAALGQEEEKDAMESVTSKLAV